MNTKLVTNLDRTDFILFRACCTLDLWLTIQPDNGLYNKPKFVAEFWINILRVLLQYIYHSDSALFEMRAGTQVVFN